MPETQNPVQEPTSLFGALPAQPHPSARIKWCGYPGPRGGTPHRTVCAGWVAAWTSRPTAGTACIWS